MPFLITREQLRNMVQYHGEYMIMPIPHHTQEKFAHRYALVWSPMLSVIVRSNNFSLAINEPALPNSFNLHPNLVLVLLRLWLIKNRNQKFIFSTLILFVIAHVATITCVVIVLINVNRESPLLLIIGQQK